MAKVNRDGTVTRPDRVVSPGGNTARTRSPLARPYPRDPGGNVVKPAKNKPVK